MPMEEVVHPRTRGLNDLVIEAVLHQRWPAFVRPRRHDAGGRTVQDRREHIRDLPHLVGTHPERGDRRRSQPQSTRVPRAVRLVRHDVAVQGDAGGAAC